MVLRGNFMLEKNEFLEHRIFGVDGDFSLN